ncbi:MAG: MMPL family transporter [Paenibacillaceae bacterium]|nr:MMPL family transporter [Paenibacillaceae bacterium]
MIEKWYNGLAKARWLVIALWLAVTVASVLVLPDLQQIVRGTEQKFVPATSESVQARNILERIDPAQKSKSGAVIVIVRDGGLQDADRSWLKTKTDDLKRDKDTLELAGLMTASDDPSLAAKFESKDGTMQLALVNFVKAENDPAVQDNLTIIEDRLKDVPAGAEVYVTGSAAISKDFQKSSEEGLQKTELLTVGLVLVILLIVFRSPIAPFVPLISIAFSLVITRGLVAWAADRFGLPVSSFTESFLIAVLFGAGTDYCILLIQRFREELSGGWKPVDAIARTMRTVGKTVVFSGSTVLIAFFLIGFAKFGLYQSAVGVSIGVAVSLLACLTLTPAIMIILGPKMFWPVKVKAGQGHGDSRLWGALSGLASRRPALVLIVAILVLSPLTLLFQGKRSFDDIAEVKPDFGSVVGFNKVKDKFGAGDIYPVTVTLTSSGSMRTPEGLAALEKISADASAVAGVAEVRSAARPLGKQLTELTVPDQLGKTGAALGDLGSGTRQVAGGLEQASKQLQQGSGDVKQLQGGLGQLAASTRQVEDGLQQLAGGLDQSAQALGGIAAGIGSAQDAVGSMAGDLGELLARNPALADDAAFQALQAKQQGAAQGLGQVAQGVAPVRQGIAAMAPSARQAAGGLAQIEAGQTQAADGVGKLQGGLDELTKGLGEGSAALRQIGDGLDQVRAAQTSIASGSGKQIAGWYVPAEALQSGDLKKALDAYMSPDGLTTKLEVVLSDNPYSAEAMGRIDGLRDALKQSAAATGIAAPDLKLTGTTTQSTELQAISQHDFLRTGGLVMLGIYIVLALLLRSALAPLYILLSLGFNYLMTMGILEFIFVKLLGHPGLSWSVSFFVFLIIVALGVDYSIFLMARFKEEYRPGGIAAAMRKAMSTTGGVIMSAAVIMGGTFAALMLSGVGTLTQIGAGILIGLLFYSIVFMGLIVPAAANLFGEANWWPSNRKRAAASAAVATPAGATSAGGATAAAE